MKKNKKEIFELCFRYGPNCKLCPRNKKCDEEIKKDREVGWCNGNILVSVAKEKSSILLPTTK